MLLPINKFLLYILLTLFITTTSFGCALCQMDIPKVSVDTKISALSTKTTFEVIWRFDKQFVSKLKFYDLNQNGKFDDDEQKAITKALEDYLYIFNHLTKITYAKRYFKSDKPIEVKPTFTKMIFKNNSMYYHFIFSLEDKPVCWCPGKYTSKPYRRLY